MKAISLASRALLSPLVPLVPNVYPMVERSNSLKGGTMRRHVWIDDDLWKRAQRAALLASVEEDQRVSVAELIRRGLEEQVAQHGGGES